MEVNDINYMADFRIEYHCKNANHIMYLEVKVTDESMGKTFDFKKNQVDTLCRGGVVDNYRFMICNHSGFALVRPSAIQKNGTLIYSRRLGGKECYSVSRCEIQWRNWRERLALEAYPR